MRRIPRSRAVPSRGRALAALRHLLPAAMGLACLWVAAAHVSMDELRAVPRLLGEVRPVAWGLALLATAGSLYAAGRYDVIAHRHFGTGIDAARAQAGGITAIALAQATGFAPLVSTYARWRLFPGLGLARVFRIALFSALAFFAGAIPVLGVLSLFPSSGLSSLAALGAACFVAATVAGSFLQPRGVARLFRHLPSLRAQAAILGWTAIDLTLAAAALHLLLPDPSLLPFARVMAVFLLAICASLVMSVPGALGPFDVVCLALLPQVPDAQMLSAIMGFRAIYIALPAGLAFVTLFFSRPRPAPMPPARGGAPHDTRLSPEAGLVTRQGGWIETPPGAAAALQPAPQALVAMFGTAGHDRARAALEQLARDRNRIPLLYRCTAREATRARLAGWRAIRVGEEAMIDLARFDPGTATRRGLRRKLARFAREGGRISCPERVPMQELTAITEGWIARNGPERGFTMGRTTRASLDGQLILLAEVAGAPVGFASFHLAPHGWALDLLRLSPEAPPGTGAALVTEAIARAQQMGVPLLSLAGLPRPMPFGGDDAAGLAQFKTQFAPDWRPTYAAAPGRLALALGLADLLRAVRWPDPPERAPHDLLENYDLAPRRPP